jgi:hypothetical protein
VVYDAAEFAYRLYWNGELVSLQPINANAFLGRPRKYSRRLFLHR